MSAPVDSASIVLEDGTELNRWKSYSLNSNFLTPTDGWDFEFGTEVEWHKVRPLLKPDRKVQIFIDGVLQCTGWIDARRVEASAEGGTVIHVHGRDVLKPLIKSNIRPSFALKGKTLAQIVEDVLQQVYLDNVPTLFTDGDSDRLLITDPNKKYQKHSSSKAVASRKHKMANVVEYYQAHAQEGAFEFVSRILRKHGLWLWATADGNLVVSGPDYEQPASYVIQRKAGDPIVQVLKSSHTWDKTNIPSLVVVHGTSKDKDWERQKIKGIAQDETWELHTPTYIKHDEATTPEECINFAMQELSRLKQDEFVYECTVRGHRDPVTEALYQTNTIAKVSDEILEVQDDLWVLDRTFHKSVDGGTYTDLKLIPKYAIRLSDVDAP